MAFSRFCASALILTLTAGVSPIVAAGQQAPPTTGTIAGRATDEARKPYANYVVQLRDVDTGQIVTTVPLDTQGRYRFTDVPLTRHFIIELYNVKDREMICTEGPQTLTADKDERNDLNIDCGATPAALWLLMAATGAVAATGIVTQSASE
ncbi:MAG: hypothetical protein ABS36_11270 [Acidobacteria bacterium SCN 69-37]|nr:MAG: hypothetical protein ABS36_11270 [Acidobacteria bacterium SCN 69-37]